MEEEPCRRFMVLSDFVRDYSFVPDPRPFRMVECGRKEAYGCRSNGDAIVKGLTLFARLGRDDDPNNMPELWLRATDEVFRRVGAELGLDVDKARRYTKLNSSVYTVDGDVMVLGVSFVFTTSRSRADVSYYLVYDSAAASLSLLPSLPPCCRPAWTKFPLMVKVKAGEDGHSKYSLVLMAERSTSASTKYTDPVLCLWSPPPPPSPDNDDRRDCSRSAWDLKARVRASAMAGPFEAHVAFSCKGRAVWGDLGQGIVYCDSNHLIDDETEPVVLKQVMLPEECRTAAYDSDVDQDPVFVFRTMGCVGDSVWFVVIEPSFDRPGDTTVKVWILSGEEWSWSLHTAFSMQSVWKLELFRAMGLPKTVPKFPFLRPRRDGRAALYMILPEPFRGGAPYGHLVCIDLSSAYKVRILSRKHFCRSVSERPFLLDRDFFDRRHIDMRL